MGVGGRCIGTIDVNGLGFAPSLGLIRFSNSASASMRLGNIDANTPVEAVRDQVVCQIKQVNGINSNTGSRAGMAVKDR
jgi:hypothetical protein